MERVAFEQDWDYEAGGPPCLSVSAIERTTRFAAYPVWTRDVYTQYLQGDIKPDVSGRLQSQTMGLQLLLPKKPRKYLLQSKLSDTHKIMMYVWVVLIKIP